MKTRGMAHEVADPIDTNQAFQGRLGLHSPDHHVVHQRILLHRSATLHAGEQIRRGASLAVRDSNMQPTSAYGFCPTSFYCLMRGVTRGQCFCIGKRCEI